MMKSREEEIAEDILGTILDRYGEQCVSQEYATQYIQQKLCEIQGKQFEITASAC